MALSKHVELAAALAAEEPSTCRRRPMQRIVDKDPKVQAAQQRAHAAALKLAAKLSKPRCANTDDGMRNAYLDLQDALLDAAYLFV